MTPSTTRSDLDSVEMTLRWAAAWGLVGSPPMPEAVAALDARQGEDLVARAIDQRVIGVLATIARSGTLTLPPATVELAEEAHRSALVWCLRLEVELLELHTRLSEAGIEPLVLKGPAAAHLDTADPSHRTFGDLDLLVTAADLPRAVGLIEAAGGRRLWPERRSGFDQRFAKSVTLRRTDGVEVDVHRSLCDGAHGFRIPLADLHRNAARFVVGGRPLGCLNRIDRVLHTAHHLALGSPVPRLMSERDLATHLTDPELRVGEVTNAAQRWGGEAVFAAAIRRTVSDLGVRLPVWEQWADELRVSRRERAIVERQRREGSGVGWGKLDALVEMDRWADRAAYGWALAFPNRSRTGVRPT